MITVLFEETGEEREVRSLCKRCEKAYWAPMQFSDVTIVSRFGTGHLSNDTGEETLCGINATDDSWWHKL